MNTSEQTGIDHSPISVQLPDSMARSNSDTMRYPKKPPRWWWATNLLVFMLLMFLGTFWLEGLMSSPVWWAEMLRAAAAAGLIGACADWFSVVAIFRHPLGLAIPHTAVIPKGKDVLADKIETFIIENFSDGRKASEHVKDIRPSKNLAHWFMQAENTSLTAKFAVKIISLLISKGGDEKNLRRLTNSIILALREYNVLPMAGKILRTYYEKGSHHEIIDYAIEFLTEYIDSNPGLFKDDVARKSSWFIPTFIDEIMADSLEDGMRKKLEKLQNRQDATRLQLEGQIFDIIQDLESGTLDAEGMLDVWKRFVGSPEVRRQINELYTFMKRELSAGSSSALEKFEAEIARILDKLCEELHNNLEFQEYVDSQLPKLVEYLSSEGLITVLANVIGNTVKDWTGDKVSAELESAVGEHLQYIRISGTGLGFGLGIVLFGVEWAIFTLV